LEQKIICHLINVAEQEKISDIVDFFHILNDINITIPYVRKLKHTAAVTQRQERKPFTQTTDKKSQTYYWKAAAT
jgi:hypothetical protein